MPLALMPYTSMVFFSTVALGALLLWPWNCVPLKICNSSPGWSCWWYRICQNNKSFIPKNWDDWWAHSLLHYISSGLTVTTTLVLRQEYVRDRVMQHLRKCIYTLPVAVKIKHAFLRNMRMLDMGDRDRWCWLPCVGWLDEEIDV